MGSLSLRPKNQSEIDREKLLSLDREIDDLLDQEEYLFAGADDDDLYEDEDNFIEEDEEEGPQHFTPDYAPPPEPIRNNHFLIEFINSPIPTNQVRGYTIKYINRRIELEMIIMDTVAYQVNIQDLRSLNSLVIRLIDPANTTVRTTAYSCVNGFEEMSRTGDYSDGILSVVRVLFTVSEIN